MGWASGFWSFCVTEKGWVKTVLCYRERVGHVSFRVTGKGWVNVSLLKDNGTLDSRSSLPFCFYSPCNFGGLGASLAKM
jgi:hypothetical protein